ncbi:hypothetical protein [Paraoerskovia marina]|uniref:hypothetical protein n=1 Tax=Paraoerskovia marina TaxID=545619 RepID=UPI0012DE4D42|nr:hypothetical protein [Paraoerskovia marina]
MNRPFNWHPLANEDPLPGDVTVVTEAAERLRSVKIAIDRVAQDDSTVLALEDMESDAVAAVAKRAEATMKSVEDAADRYAVASRALDDYAEALTSAQVAADAALEAAQSAQFRAHDAAEDQRILESIQANADPMEPPDRSLAWRIQDAAWSQQSAQATIDSAAEDLALAVRRHDEAAEVAAAAIRGSFDDGLTDGWWETWGKTAMEWTSKVAGWIATTAGVLALVLAWVPGLGPALGAIAIIAGIVALVADFVLAFNGDKSWGAVALSALGVATFGVGRVAIAGLRFATHGGAAMSRIGMRGVGLASKSSRSKLDLGAMTDSAKLQAGTYTQAKEVITKVSEPGAFGEAVRRSLNPFTTAKDLWGDLKGIGQVKEFAKHPIGNIRESFSGSARDNLLTFVGLGDDVKDVKSIVATGQDGRAATLAANAPATRADDAADSLSMLMNNAAQVHSTASVVAVSLGEKLVVDTALHAYLTDDMVTSFTERSTGPAPTPAERLGL